ncbi:MAG: PHP domain-containing protein [Deltaproteobacteria bacterium]|nr:PHP domain-containing protein [Deltaproteobacteria bacterium]
MLIKADLHNHTTFSFDGEMSPRRFVKLYARLGFGAVAVTEHNTILGALAVRDLDPPFKVIVGEEIKSKQGEIIGLFLEKNIRKGMSAVDTAKAIHDQGGLTLLPHPFVYLVPSRMDHRVLPELLPHLDIIENINARAPEPTRDRFSALWSRTLGVTASAGSDAHNAGAVGNGYVLMEDFDDPQDFLEKLGRAAIVSERRESMFRTALNFALGHTWGPPRVFGMIRRYKRGAPIRAVWDPAGAV